MIPTWLPGILGPEYHWHRPMATNIANSTPPVPRVRSWMSRRFWALCNTVLSKFSQSYCEWTGQPFNPACRELPFGLVLKWTERTRIEEILAMQMARAAGIPVPKVIGYGEHPHHFARISILMTRSPGIELSWLASDAEYTQLFDEESAPWKRELQQCLAAMRQWHNPYGRSRICSVLNTKITTHRVPRHAMGPFDDKDTMHTYLLTPANPRPFPSRTAFEEKLALATIIKAMPHDIVFSHGDFKTHNIMIGNDGHLMAILDWECAGWYPEYWEYTTAMRYIQGTWWYEQLCSMGGNHYLKEMDCERALTSLTVDSYAGM